MSAVGGNYPIQHRKGEIERLHIQADAIAPDAGVMLDRIGVQPGWTCLDLGCGPRGITDLLSERVGAGGRVVGLDKDEEFSIQDSVEVPLAEAYEVFAERVMKGLYYNDRDIDKAKALFQELKEEVERAKKIPKSYEIKEKTVTLRRIEPIDLAFHEALSGTLQEWLTKEDEEAFRDL